MTDEVGNLVLGHLRALAADLGSIKEDLRGLRTKQTASLLEARAMGTGLERLPEGIANVKVRLDRIENRLGLVGHVN